MKPLRSYNRKARRRLPKWKYLRNKINKITREEIFPKYIDWFWSDEPRFYKVIE